MTMTIGGTSGLVFPDSSTQNTAATGFGFKNRIINGAMVIDQRNSGASVAFGSTTVAGNYYGYTLDRWFAQSYSTTAGNGAAFTVQQNAGSVALPSGFTNYLGVTVTTAQASLSATSIYRLTQYIEGLNCADLDWGLSTAKTVTISFWVRSSLTGTFGGAIGNSAGNMSYPFSYTISAANTWEQKTISIPGPTSGTWLTTNGTGLSLRLSLGASASVLGAAGSWAASDYYGVTGQTNLISTNGATFYITGVQLEKGSTATSFDYRPYGTELALCQRYYQLTQATYQEWIYVEDSANQNNRWWQFYIPQTMRSTPSVSLTGFSTGVAVGGVGTVSSLSADGVSLNRVSVRVSFTGTGGVSHQIFHTDGWVNQYAKMSAEL